MLNVENLVKYIRMNEGCVECLGAVIPWGCSVPHGTVAPHALPKAFADQLGIGKSWHGRRPCPSLEPIASASASASARRPRHLQIDQWKSEELSGLSYTTDPDIVNLVCIRESRRAEN